MIINNVPIKELIKFGKLSERSQSTFAKKVTTPKKPKSEEEKNEARNYWHRCLTGVGSASKQNNNEIITERIESLMEVYEPCEKRLVRLMYKRNLEILKKYEEFNFANWYPKSIFKFISKDKTPLIIKGIPLEVRPQHVFTFGEKEAPSFGGIFFVADVLGYQTNDLATFSEAVFEHLRKQYKESCYIDPKFCMAIDISSMELVCYKDVLEGKTSSSLKKLAEKLSGLL